MNKKTEELINELKESPSIVNYLANNSTHFLECDLAEYISIIMKEKGIKKTDIVKHSQLSEVYAYQILAGMKKPERDKLLCIIFALKLEVSEANRLLKIAGKSELYVKNRRDSILIFALGKKLAVAETNDLLYELGQPVLT